MTHNDFLFSLGRLGGQLEELDRKLGAMCKRLENMVSDLEREAAA
ncbi:hypothetical protein [Methanothrix soehngenii]